MRLLGEAQPTANVTPAEREQWLTGIVGAMDELAPEMKRIARERAERLKEAHRRVRRVTREGQMTSEPQLPVDLLGVYVLAPIPKGVK